MRRFLNHIKGAAAAAATYDTTRIGTITGYDPGTCTVKVMIQPDEVETGWIPLLSPWVGNGWGMVCGPNIGDAVKVSFERGNLDTGVAELRFFNDVDRAPGASSGEFWLIHKSGSLLKFTNDGKVLLTSHSDLMATVGGNLSATVAGDATATVQGNLTATVTGTAKITAAAAQIVASSIQLCQALTDTLKALCTSVFATWATGHVHSGGTLSGGLTGVPTSAPPAGALTSVVTAE